MDTSNKPYSPSKAFHAHALKRAKQSAVAECRRQRLDAYTYADDAAADAVSKAIDAAHRIDADNPLHRVLIRNGSHFIRYAKRAARGFIATLARGMEKLPKSHPDVVLAAFHDAALIMHTEAAAHRVAASTIEDLGQLDVRTQAIVDGLELGKSSTQAIADAGISRCTGFDLLNALRGRIEG